VPAAAFILVQAPVEWISSQATIHSFEQRFSRYLPPTVLREIVRRHGLAAFKPERRRISVLFVDIEGYTRLAEQMTPEELVAMTELVLTRLTRCVHETQGTLDKYIGDAIMAFWGAPLEQADHADRAIDCALAMLKELEVLNSAREPLLIDQMVRARIGINTGSAVVGELGSTTRQSYTAIGDAINVAARLQDYAKVAGTYLLVGEETARAVTRHNLHPYAQATLRGRVAPEMLYVLSEESTGVAQHA
jgi:adenylate cyclase